jgi:hypothetical protein
MPPQELLLLVLCLVDDELKALGPPRSRGPAATLADSEVVTIEVVGELWGIADDRALLDHFLSYHAAEFPALASVHRTTFARQAANLCWIKRRPQARLAERLSPPGDGWLIDSAPLPACFFARARRFAGVAAYGYDPVAAKAFYGFRLHLRTSPDGVVVGYALAPANAAELALARELAPRPVGVGLGDRGYWSPELREELRAAGGEMLAPFKKRGSDPDPERSERLLAVRRQIETTFGELVERLGCRRIKVKDLWHLEHRLVRKILVHTAATWLNVLAGRPPLQIERLVA